MTNIDLIREVKRNAVNHWGSVLPACGVDVPERGKHGACPVCGGTDRFHFIDDHRNGNWFCRQCDAPNHGDGLDLIAKVKGISVLDAAKEVSQALSLPLPERARQEAPKSAAQPIAEKVRKLVAQTTTGQSAYLTTKGHTCPVRLLEDGSLLLVIRRGDEVTGAQIIRPDGEKRLIAGTRKKGSFIPVSELPETTDTVLIAEGYATALTVAQLHDGLVLAAIDEGNLLPVTEWAAGRYPEAKIIIAADNDIKPGQPNVGKISAEKAVKSFHRGWVTLPPTEDKADWDDCRQQYGTEAAKQAFSKGLYQVNAGEAEMTSSVVIKLDDHRAKERDPLIPFVDTRKEGLFYVIPKLDKETGEIIRPEQWLSDPMKPVARGMNEYDEHYLIIEYGRGKTKALPNEGMGDREGWKSLRRTGVNVTAKPAMRNILSDWLDSHRHLETWSITHKSGWHKGAYIMPDGSVIGTPDQPVLFNGQSAAATAYQVSGTAESWRNEVARLADGNIFMMFAIGAALAAPMSGITMADSFGIHIYAQSTAGKSTTADMAVSLYGHPDLQRLTWYGTAYGIANEAVAHNDGLLYLDEVGQGADPKHVYKSAYTLFNGKGKIQGAKDGGNRPMENWRTVAISTGEKDIETFLLNAGVKVNAGQLVRLLNIPIERATELHECESGKHHADTLKVNCRAHYGSAGRHWIEYLSAHKNEAREAYHTAQKRWNKLIPANYGEQVHRASDRFAAIEAALLTGRIITGWSEQDCRDAIQAVFNVWLAEFGTGNKEIEQIVEQATAFLNTYGMSRYAPLPYDERDMPVRDLAGYRERKGGHDDAPIIFYTLPSAFKQEMAKGFNAESFAAALTTIGMLKKPARGKGYQGRTPRLKHLGNTQQRAYVMMLIQDEEE
ncbi:MAG TPA: DNA primase [Morganella sp. (in: Bacteria)]|nr:DNA primase [Morganella sp. (in: enterobacteria)]